MSIKIIPYMSQDTLSTLLTLSTAAAIAILLLVSPLALFNLVPVHAQTTNLSFRTPTPASGTSPTGAEVALMFDAHGTYSSTDPQNGAITSGTMEITENGQRAYSGNITGGTYKITQGGEFIFASGPIDQSGDTFSIDTTCSTSDNNDIGVTIKIQNGGGTDPFNGPVECSSDSQAGGDTTQSSLTGTTTRQDSDSDGDGIPDSSDRCTHNSNPRCFKEGETAT